MITLHTNFGDIKLELDFDKAPKSAANFPGSDGRARPIDLDF